MLVILLQHKQILCILMTTYFQTCCHDCARLLSFFPWEKQLYLERCMLHRQSVDHLRRREAVLGFFLSVLSSSFQQNGRVQGYRMSVEPRTERKLCLEHKPEAHKRGQVQTYSFSFSIFPLSRFRLCLLLWPCSGNEAGLSQGSS